MTAVFEKHGLRIQYPENWELQENEPGEKDQANDHAVDLQIVAPSGAFWSLLVFKQDVNAEELMESVLESIREQYESIETSPATETLSNHDMTGYDTFFFCLDLLVCNRMRCFEYEGHQLLLMYQAENRDFDSMEPVFSAMTVGMLASQGTEKAGGVT